MTALHPQDDLRQVRLMLECFRCFFQTHQREQVSGCSWGKLLQAFSSASYVPIAICSWCGSYGRKGGCSPTSTQGQESSDRWDSTRPGNPRSLFYLMNILPIWKSIRCSHFRKISLLQCSDNELLLVSVFQAKNCSCLDVVIERYLNKYLENASLERPCSWMRFFCPWNTTALSARLKFPHPDGGSGVNNMGGSLRGDVRQHDPGHFQQQHHHGPSRSGLWRWPFLGSPLDHPKLKLHVCHRLDCHQPFGISEVLWYHPHQSDYREALQRNHYQDSQLCFPWALQPISLARG